MRYWSGVPWTSIDSAREMIAKDREAMPAGTHLRFGIETADTHALVGTCTLFAFSEQCRRAEIGYSLVPAMWGRGYMHEALTALLAYGFETLALNRVEADIDPRNRPSARVLERLRFREEGFLRERWIVAGEVSHSALFGLLRSDWDARASGAPPIAPGPGFVVLYRWRIDAAQQASFVAAWSRITELLRRDHGSGGSRLHRGADGLWYGYAQWPSEDARQRAFAQPVDPDASARMRSAIVESLPEVRLEAIADYLVPPTVRQESPAKAPPSDD